MAKEINTIGVLTSGGDAPGMNNDNSCRCSSGSLKGQEG